MLIDMYLIKFYCGLFIEEEILTLQTSFKSSLKEKELLQKAKKELNEFIMLLKKDYNVVSQELHQKSLELNKTSTQLFNMENRCKVYNFIHLIITVCTCICTCTSLDMTQGFLFTT